MKRMSSISILVLLIVSTTQLMGQSSVSSDIHIPKGKKVNKNVSTVSGDIFIGADAVISADISAVSGDIEIGTKARTGKVDVVSGDISVGKGARTGSLETVSGDIRLYEKSQVEGTVETVSGDVNCDSGVEISEQIKTVSGDIELDDARLRGDIVTVSGDISLFNGTMVDGDIHIQRKPGTVIKIPMKQKVIVDMNSVVRGSIIVDKPNTNVIVYLVNGGRVKGEIVNAEVRKQ